MTTHSHGDLSYAADADFLARLPGSLRSLGETFLRELRLVSHHAMQYREPSGKFVATPLNVFSVKIQPVAKSLRITVRARVDQLTAHPSLSLRSDRSRSYTRFFVSEPSQIQPAVDVIAQTILRNA